MQVVRRGKYSIGSSPRHSGHSAVPVSTEADARLTLAGHGISLSDALSQLSFAAVKINILKKLFPIFAALYKNNKTKLVMVEKTSYL